MRQSVFRIQGKTIGGVQGNPTRSIPSPRSKCIMEQSGNVDASLSSSSRSPLSLSLSILLIPLCLPQFAATCSLPDMCHGHLSVPVSECVCVCVCNQDPQLPYAISALLEHTINTWGLERGSSSCTRSKSQFAFLPKKLLFVFFLLPPQMTNLSEQCNSKSYSKSCQETANPVKCR